MLTLLRPRYWPGHLLMVVCVAIATGLGLWQLDAWQTRRDDAARDLSNKPAVKLSSVMTGDSAFPGRSLGRQVLLAGRWVGDNVYISDRYDDGKRGYWVVNAVEVLDTHSAMPVVLGWSAKPSFPTPPKGYLSRIEGWLQASEGSGPLDEDPTDDVIPTMRIASLVEKYPIDLYSGYVVAKLYTSNWDLHAPPAPQPEPVSPSAIPSVSGTTALRNFLYAIEWWVFAGFAIFVWVRWCKDTLYPPDLEEDEE